MGQACGNKSNQIKSNQYIGIITKQHVEKKKNREKHHETNKSCLRITNKEMVLYLVLKQKLHKIYDAFKIRL